METTNRKSINDRLNKYTYSSNNSDFIEVTEWTNGEGHDVVISTEFGEKHISISDGELDAINYLVQSLRYSDKTDK